MAHFYKNLFFIWHSDSKVNILGLCIALCSEVNSNLQYVFTFEKHLTSNIVTAVSDNSMQSVFLTLHLFQAVCH